MTDAVQARERETLSALVQHLQRSQWAPAQDIAESQLRQLGRLAEHCAAESPAFRSRLEGANLHATDLTTASGLAALPLLTRRDVQSAGDDLFCRRIPDGHGSVFLSQTSGSTGEPVLVRRTGVSHLFWRAMAMRDYQWRALDVRARLCSIRANVYEYTRYDTWGPPASLLGDTGPALSLPIATDTRRLVDWVAEFAPQVLIIYPTTLAAITDYCESHRIHFPGLTHIQTMGETLAPAIRAGAEAWFGAAVADCYSSQEIGYIALQCPSSGLYHTAAESVLAEVLDDDGRPCAEGESGRVVITDLHNFATPLVRYAIGDFAEVAGPCPCGRGLPAWRRILGRERNFIRMPDGSRFWPITGFIRAREIAPVAQYQFVQRAADTIEARLVVDRPLSADEEDGLRALFTRSVGHPFTLQLTYYQDRIPAGPSGKFEEFIYGTADL